jgi:hypothetical protein
MPLSALGVRINEVAESVDELIRDIEAAACRIRFEIKGVLS